MGAPSINIAFYEQSTSSISRGDKGILAAILVDTGVTELTKYTILDTTDIPDEFSDDNVSHIKRALIGYQNPPKKIIVIAIPSSENYDDAMTELNNYDWDYVFAPTCETDGVATDIASWIKSQRENNNKIYKAVLPNTAYDYEGIVNVTRGYTDEDGTVLSAEDACSRYAGIIAGTPWTMSCTYAPITEAIACPAWDSQEDLDDAVDAGEFVVMWDGEKAKVVRGVNSFTTTSDSKGDKYKKIKIVEVIDLIHHDLRQEIDDSYIGKYNNSYDNKNLLITAINGYFDSFVSDGILASGKCELDVDAIRTYIKSNGGSFVLDGETIELEDATELQVLQADTGSYVFLKCTMTILDALEDVDIEIYFD